MNEILTRGDGFKLLAACFYEPDTQLFIEEKLAVNLESLMENFSPDARQAARNMAKALDELSQEKLSVDHAALFLGPFELIAAPYGSVYIEKKRTVKADSTMFVARCYHDAGLSVDLKEPEDHVAIELEFMYHLCRKEADAIRDNRLEDAAFLQDMQIKFYFKAMKPWIVDFCAAIKGGTANDFYRNVADCLESFFTSCETHYRKGSPVKIG